MSLLWNSDISCDILFNIWYNLQICILHMYIYVMGINALFVNEIIAYSWQA